LGRVVLLIHHGPALRTVVRLHLGGAARGAADEFVEAQDAAAAREILRARAVDLVIADVASGRGDEPTLLEVLRDDASARGVPVVIVAARPAPALFATWQALPRCAVVEEPVTAPRLQAALDALAAAEARGSAP
jgi:CheY-like chemotaxis protein